MESKITYRTGTGEDTSIPNRATIAFQVDDGEIEVSLRDGKVRVYGSDGLVVKSMASNAVNLSVRR